MSILHITPALPPAINGLGDFSKILVDNLKEKGFKKNSFLVYDKDQSNDEVEEAVIQLNRKDLYGDLEKLRPDTIILHYVGYAYEKNGLPFYLYLGLEKYKKNYVCKILVFFHELYSSSYNPFKLPFYSHYFQKKIVEKLYNLSFITFTNCEVYKTMLQKLIKKRTSNNICTGIYSNIPDNLFKSEIDKINHLMAVFGSNTRRRAVYTNRGFLNLLEKIKVKEIYDIGPGSVSFSHPSINFVAKGSLPPNEVAILLNKARFGAIEYPADILGKSGIFSAYAAFGVIAINLNLKEGILYDKLVEGKNYFTLDTNIIEADFEIIEEEIKKWYSTRSTKQITKVIAKYLI